ncbi:MAG TPA: DUF5915 domain-containing protein, partial [Flavisolibacter sp.]|nr:DUF5915 domain-containing protein [Flavisolibacter sp.]
IPVFNPATQQQLQKIEDLIKNEVNIKEIEYLTDTEGFIKKKLKPNFGALGKKLGSKMKEVTAAILEIPQAAIAEFEKEGSYAVRLSDGETVALLLSDVEILSEDIPGWSVASKGALTVALDINITAELAHEGIAREFVNKLQNLRKDNGLQVTDRIDVKVSATNGIKEALAKFNNYICAEILADTLELSHEIDGGTEIEVNNNLLSVIVLKKG